MDLTQGGAELDKNLPRQAYKKQQNQQAPRLIAPP